MLVVGFNGSGNLVDEGSSDLDVSYMHDAAAVLVQDGRVVAAIEQERLDRIKHSGKFPIEAIRFCLDRHRVGAGEVDAFVYYSTKWYSDILLRQNGLKRNLERQRGDTPQFLESEEFFAHLLSQGLGQTVPTERIRFVHHHVAHLVSAFACSGFERSLLLSIDGSGERESGRVAVGRGGAIDTLRRFGQDLSIGRFYNWAIRYLGFLMFDAYKAMGLAPYGNPARFRDEFQRFYQLLPNGEYRTNTGHFLRFFDVMKPRRRGETFTQEHKDFAASLQEALERIVFHVLRHFRKTTGETNLCLAGGVAHNCTMNGKIAASGMFEQIFVQPAAHDAGCALGAALSVYYQHRDPQDREAPSLVRSLPGFYRLRRMARRGLRRLAMTHRMFEPRMAAPTINRPRPPIAPFEHLYWGTDIGQGEAVRASLDRWRDLVDIEQVEAIEKRTAVLLAEGNVIGWVQGRSEFGPRALGNRSILADARPAENKQIINSMVKKREGFRPFAPSVLEEDARGYFALPGMTASPYMIFVVNVLEDKRALLGAVTHVDGSARVQTVSRHTNPRYWNLIHEFKQLTGVPVLLNTSFNNNAEPIVDSIDDAVACFLTTNLHYLVVDEFVVKKKKVAPSAYCGLVPRIPHHLRVSEVRRFERDRFVTEYVVTSNADPRFQQTLSAEGFDVLRRADGVALLGDLLSDSGIAGTGMDTGLLAEMSELWSARVVMMSPGGSVPQPVTHPVGPLTVDPRQS